MDIVVDSRENDQYELMTNKTWLKKSVFTCCCWLIEGGVITTKKFKEIVWISSEKYLPDGEEMFIGVGLGLIGMIIGFGGVIWVFVQKEDMGMILTKTVFRVQSRSPNRSIIRTGNMTQPYIFPVK